MFFGILRQFNTSSQHIKLSLYYVYTDVLTRTFLISVLAGYWPPQADRSYMYIDSEFQLFLKGNLLSERKTNKQTEGEENTEDTQRKLQ